MSKQRVIELDAAAIMTPLAVNPYFRFELTDTEKAYLTGDKA